MLREQPEFAAHTKRIRETFERHGLLGTGH
jgi:hypothetical protein